MIKTIFLPRSKYGAELMFQGAAFVLEPFQEGAALYAYNSPKEAILCHLKRRASPDRWSQVNTFALVSIELSEDQWRNLFRLCPVSEDGLGYRLSAAAWQMLAPLLSQALPPMQMRLVSGQRAAQIATEMLAATPGASPPGA